MLVYEKDNKLNINFDNKVDDSPDLSIGKSGDKTQILVDGQKSGGGGANVLTLYFGLNGDTPWAYKNPELTEVYANYEEAYSALNNADVIVIMSPVGSTMFKTFCVSCWANPPGIDEGYVSAGNAEGDSAYLWKERDSGGGQLAAH